MDEKNEDKDMQEELASHVCDLIATLETMNPESEEYGIVERSVVELSDILIRIDEIQNKWTDQDAQRKHEIEMEKLRQEAAEKARKAEERLKEIEQAEMKRWHTIDMWLRIATISVNVLTVTVFAGTAWVQTRMNYVDNVYDASNASRMILNGIGKMLKPS